MSRQFFNPPPGWPVPAGWEPPKGWMPDPSWPPAPPGWSFWTEDESNIDAIGPESGQSACSPRISGRLLVGAGAILAVILIVALVVHASARQDFRKSLAGDSGSDTPTSTSGAAPNPIATTLVNRGTWKFSNRDGYSYDMTVALSTPVKFSDVRGSSHPNDSSLVVGQQCGDGPKYQTAAVILGQMSATATTPNFDTKIDMHMQIGGSSDRLMFAQAFANGNSACDTNDDYGRWPSFGVEFNNPVQTGKAVTQAFLVIILNYYDTPSGDVEFGRQNFARPASGQLQSSSDAERAAHFTTDDTFKTPLVDSPTGTTQSSELPTADNWTGTWTSGGTSSAATLSLSSISPMIGDITIPGLCAAHWTEEERRTDISRLVTAHVTSGSCLDNTWNVIIGRDNITGTDSVDPSTSFAFTPS